MQMCDTRILCVCCAITTTTSSLSFARAYLPIQISPFLIFLRFSSFWRNFRVKWKRRKIKNKINPRRVAPAAFRSRPAKTSKHFSSSSELQSRACALTFFSRKNGQKVPAERDEREADQTFRSRTDRRRYAKMKKKKLFWLPQLGIPAEN